MKKTNSLSLAAIALAAIAAACGGPASTSVDPGAADQKFLTATPTFDHASVQIDDSDANPSSLEAGNTLQQDVTADDCHPHLFSRTHEIAARLNRHTWKLLRHVRDIIADHPKFKDGSTHTWESVKDGLDRKFTISLSADGSTYTFELDLGQAAAAGSTTPAALVKVYGGTLSASTVAGVVTTNVSMTFDYDALHSVIATEKARGQLAITAKIVKDPSKPAPSLQKTMTIAFTNFLPEEGDAHGPRTGSFTHLGEPGIGGSMTFADSLILFCPANPTAKVADTQTVARWFKKSTGGIAGRADAKASGGQIPTGDNYLGVSCHNGTPGQGTTREVESAYWMMKLEDAAGNTVSGSSHEAINGGTSPCDAALGQVPSLTNNATDFNFAAAVSFPGQW